jgi:hypothetical protein
VTVGERITKLGFKRWYERTLIESHAFLVTSLFGAILTFTGLELFSQHEGLWMRVAIAAAAVVIGSIVAVASAHRYIRMLMLAINLGERATCPSCKTYAKFDILKSGRIRSEGADGPGSLWMKVKCKKCGGEWRIE